MIMSETVGKFMVSVVFLVSLLSLVSLGAAEFQVYKGDSVALENANTTITWGKNYTFNASSINAENDTLSVGNRNISIGSKTSAQVNSTLWKYNLTGPYHGKAAVELGVSAVNGTNVSISFDSLPGFRFGRYELDQNNSLLREFRSGGEITWYETNWSAHNYTVTYYNDTEGPILSLSLETGSLMEGGDIKISCSASDISGISSSSLTVTDPSSNDYNLNCGQEFEETSLTGSYTASYSATDKAGNGNSVSRTFDVVSSDSGGGGGSGEGSSGGGGSSSASTEVSDGHSWISANRDQFSFESIDEAVGVRSVTVSTARNLSSFSLSVTRMETKPSLPELPENAYQFYGFTAENENEISSTEIEFEVNRSFAERYDEIIVSHYENGWKDLPTTRVDSAGSTWIYKAETTGFSYYLVRGQDRKTGDQTGSKELKSQTGPNNTEPVCGDDACNMNESWKTCSTDCSKPQIVIEVEAAISKAENQLNRKDEEYKLLERARTAFKRDDYREAQRLAEKAVQQGDEKRNSSSLSTVRLVAGLILIVLILGGAGYICYRRWLNQRIGQEINQISQEVTEKIRNRRELKHREQIADEIDRAEDELRQDQYLTKLSS